MAKKSNRRTRKIPEDESKAERFIRVVEPRIGKAVKAIEVIGLCGGSTYEHTAKQVTEIRGTLERAIKRALDSLESNAPATGGFSFEK